MFPSRRPRRLRRTAALRALVRETAFAPSNFVMPYFVTSGRGVRRPIASMPGQFQFSVDELLKEAAAAVSLGIPAVLLFGIPARKDSSGSGAWAANGIVQQATRALKKALPGLVVITDLCFCEYTTHGHCGTLKKRGPSADVDNDATLKLIERTAVSQARAGADLVAPSGMMDGTVAASRRALDRAGFTHTGILAYAAKFASAFYGPFRAAAGSTPTFGDRRSYQMDPANAREAMREMEADVDEGADIVMVKPALSYLDIITDARELGVPVAAYNVSGEYAMVKAAARNGWIDEERAVNEILTSLRRAGADILITYHAVEVARRLRRPG